MAFLADEEAAKEGAVLIFTEDTFNIMFGAPSANKELFVRAIDKTTNEVVGFLGSIPRKLSIEGKRYNFIIPAWLAVHWKHQKKGLAKAMGKKMLEIGLEAGYEGGFALHEPEQHGVDTSRAVAREMGFLLERLVRIKQFVIRIFDVEKVATVVKLRWFERFFFSFKQKVKAVKSSQVRIYESKDLDQIYKLIEKLVERDQISIVPDYQDVKWMLENPKVICAVHEDKQGKIDGFAIVWEFLLAGFGNKHPFGWLDAVHTYQLSVQEATELANFLCLAAKKRGWIGIQTPYIPYFDAKPFKKANFVFFRKKLNLDIFNPKNIPLPKRVRSFYFDWR